MGCEALLKRAAAGDRQAFAQLYRDTKGMVYATVLSVVRDRHAAEDLMQDTYVTVLQKAAAYRGRGAKTWIATIARNKALDHLRRRSREVFVDYSENESLYGSYEIEVQFADNLVLKTALAALAGDERQIFLMSNAGLKQREIAAVLALPAGTVAWKYRKAVQQMQILLREEWI